MRDKKIVMVIAAGLCFGVAFIGLLTIRIGHKPSVNLSDTSSISVTDADFSAREQWMAIKQFGRTIGYAHTIFNKNSMGYEVDQSLFFRFTIMEMVRDLTMRSTGQLNADFSLASFGTKISSGLFEFEATGKMTENRLDMITRTAGVEKTTTLEIDERVFFSAGLADALMAKGLQPSNALTGRLFDPSAMTHIPFTATVLGDEIVDIAEVPTPATKIAIDVKGLRQFAWISGTGEVIKEQGLLGMTLEKTTRNRALSGHNIKASEDLTQIASIAVDPITQPVNSLSRLVVKIDGVELDEQSVTNERQSLQGDIITIDLEMLSAIRSIPVAENSFAPEMKVWLESTPFIQSNHPLLQEVVRQTTDADDTPLGKVEKLMQWIKDNIEKKPVLSLPDAISTLKNRQGDCNEHAMLMAAMARAANIPARVETGIVYMKGRFYYHAWNMVYVGDWLAVDTALDQIPADVTHVRLSSGNEDGHLDLLRMIGNVKLKIIDYD
ncbi:MAG: transglutaminase domain-containing protein [Desulfobacteraceae bacterium]|nr:transglutaminase domain-containing protein [Desulfobacteraceae bacterium]